MMCEDGPIITLPYLSLMKTLIVIRLISFTSTNHRLLLVAILCIFYIIKPKLQYTTLKSYASESAMVSYG